MDNVNHPAHYNQNGIETIDFIELSLNKEEYKGFLKGNIIKYLDRWEFKNGLEDLKKAQWYACKLIDKLIESNWEMANSSWFTFDFANNLASGDFEGAAQMFVIHRKEVEKAVKGGGIK